MHFFQDSLSGAPLNWYMRLHNTIICSWENLVDHFIKQSKYTMDITSLSNWRRMTQKHKGIYSEIERSRCIDTSTSSRKRDGDIIRQQVENALLRTCDGQFNTIIHKCCSRGGANRVRNHKWQNFCTCGEKGFEGKRKDVEHFEDDYKGTKKQLQNYHNPSSQIANINLQAKDPPKNFQK